LGGRSLLTSLLSECRDSEAACRQPPASLEGGGVSSTHPHDGRLRRASVDGNQVECGAAGLAVDNADHRPVYYSILGPHMGHEVRSTLCLDCRVRMKLVRELSWLGPTLPAVQLFQCAQCGRADTVELPEKPKRPHLMLDRGRIPDKL
jgi:hypothetical protein